MMLRFHDLRRRDQQMAYLVALGYQNADIAAKMNTSVDMVKNFLRSLYDQTGFSNRVELALWVIKQRSSRKPNK